MNKISEKLINDIDEKVKDMIEYKCKMAEVSLNYNFYNFDMFEDENEACDFLVEYIVDKYKLKSKIAYSQRYGLSLIDLIIYNER